MSYAVETIGLTKRYLQIGGYRDVILYPFRKQEITALEDVNLQVRKGEVFGLLGPNGAGKTTLIKILCTLVLPTAGRALVNGHDVVRHDRKVRQMIGYVMSEPRSFYWRLTGRQNLRFFAVLNNLDSKEAQRRVAEVLLLVGMADKADVMFKNYSAGMRQRMCIARALLTEPEILFMDEPTNSLDPLAAQAMRRFIRDQLVGEQRRTVFLATHNLQEAEELCDRLAVIHQGRIMAQGTLDEIRRAIGTQSKTTSLDQILAHIVDRDNS